MRLEGMRVLVTGGSGFLGGFVCNRLSESRADAIPVHSKMWDLTDREQIYDMLHTTRPNAVIHLAAVVGGIGANRAAPGEFFYKNAIMGIELLEACHQLQVEKVLIAGTVCAYPKFTFVPFVEDDLWNGYPEETNAPYGLAKRMLLVQAQAYREQYGSNFIYLLPVNLYGPRDNFDLTTGHVIPHLIRKFIEAKEHRQSEVILWGDGTPTREFLYVKDAADGFVRALESYNSPQPVNLGSGMEISINTLAHTIAEMVGWNGEIIWDKTKPNGQPRRQLDTSKARRFGFEAKTDLLTGLRETIRWYNSVRDH